MAAASTMSYPRRDIFHGQVVDGIRPLYDATKYPPQHFSYGPRLYPEVLSNARPYQSSSPPMLQGGSRPSLPPISNLLGLASDERSTREPEPLEAPIQRQIEPQQQITLKRRQESTSEHEVLIPNKAARLEQAPSFQRDPFPRPQTYHRYDGSESQKLSIPPTPPFRGDSVPEGTQSPSTISSGSSLATVQGSQFLASALNNIEASNQIVRPPPLVKHHSMPSRASNSPYRTSPHGLSPHASSPNATSSLAAPSSSYYSPSTMTSHRQQHPQPGPYHRHRYSATYPPPGLPGPPPPPQGPPSAHQPSHAHPPSLHSSASVPTPGPNPWQHHHYIPPANSNNPSSAGYSLPSPQDRYICPTCAKAFSRPSSLKIHSHSHTGEKPFRCPHPGCGKSFSVRSNMKRHERGCHARVGVMGIGLGLEVV